MHRKCKQCGAELGSGAGITTKYCSRPCQVAAMRTVTKSKSCEYCGKDFISRRRFCSLDCASKYKVSNLAVKRLKRLAKEQRARSGIASPKGRPPLPKILRMCGICGKGMLLHPSTASKGGKYCSRACYGKAIGLRQTGENHHMYVDGKSNDRVSERQRLRRHPAYKEWRNAVFARDKYTCQTCTKTGGALHAHHIIAYRDAPQQRLKVMNGITLCDECHRLWHLYDKQGLFTKLESTLQAKIIAALQEYGFWVHNTIGNSLSRRGIPDLLLAYHGLMGGVEVKIHPNYLSTAQLYEAHQIVDAGGIFYVARSEDDIGRIIELFEIKIAQGEWAIS